MSSIKRTDGSPGFAPVTTADPVAPTAPVEEAKSNAAPATADQMSTDAPRAGVVTTTNPPDTTSDGKDLVGALRLDDNFGLAPNAVPGFDLGPYPTDQLHFDIGAWMQGEIAAGGDQAGHMQDLLKALGGPQALAPIDTAALETVI